VTGVRARSAYIMDGRGVISRSYLTKVSLTPTSIIRGPAGCNTAEEQIHRDAIAPAEPGESMRVTDGPEVLLTCRPPRRSLLGISITAHATAETRRES
jgi:hypothetical protein